MTDAPGFTELIRRVRLGDQAAATELVTTYEPAIRRAVRVRLADSRLGRAFDSMDVCQSVLASFFVRTALGQYDLEKPEQLLKLLSTMARHKLADRIDHERAQCRDNRRTADDAAEEFDVPGSQATPSRQIEAKDLLSEVRRRLGPDDLQLAELRAQGLEWGQIAELVGGTSEALRKRYSRALDRVVVELGLDNGGGL